ncbi:MFS polyamine transporter [Crepidotus variabilis]|uniref:MFS polyamine transporter n=1 Tax=Crepidotus variabilis TaxID=179855 RepID=A0A9P6JL38_9AGAR|nr:MFS polyamine transporter [Crepidotus variabilis]
MANLDPPFHNADPESRPTTVVDSSRSSFTYCEPSGSKSEADIGVTCISSLAQESEEVAQPPVISDIARRGEEELERYGGNDVHDPPPHDHLERLGSTIPGPPEKDANMVGWDGPNDPDNPQNWSVAYKWFVTAVVILMTVNVTFCSSAPASAASAIMKDFHVTKEVSYLTTTTFLLGYVIGPFFWGSGGELVGRRPVFVFTMSIYTILFLGQALAPNIQTLEVTRFLGGFFAVAPLTNCGGLIADIWPAIQRGTATSIFTTMLFIGPVTGPLVSGFMLQAHVSWRWIFWVMMIFAGVCTVNIIVFLPETYAPVILLKKAKKLRREDPIGAKEIYAEHEKQDWSAKGIIHRTIFRPFLMLAMEPILTLITFYISIVYGLLYGLFQAFPIVFIDHHGFSIDHDGLIFIGVGIGTTLGSVINWRTSAHYPELMVKWRGSPPPEERLYSAMLGSVILSISIFWFGWTGNYSSIPWYVAGISTVFIGMGISLIFMSFLSYLVDTYLMYSSSAFAANTIVRSAVAAAFPLFTVQMFTNLGVNWACTLIGCITLVFIPCPFLFYKYGPQIRTHSRFAPCLDLQIAAEIKQEAIEKSRHQSA